MVYVLYYILFIERLLKVGIIQLSLKVVI